MNWSIVYTWLAGDHPEYGSFHVLSPSGTMLTIASGETSGTYTVTSNEFNDKPANGKWRLWIEDFAWAGSCRAKNIKMSIDVLSSYLLLILLENAVEGMESITGTVKTSSIQEKDLMVALSSNDPSRLYVQTETIIKAGDDSANFSMTIVDDQLLNGSSDIQIIAATPCYYTGTGIIHMNDNESAVLTIALPYSATEGDQDVQGTIQVSQPVDCYFDIPLISSDTNIITVPEIVTVPEGLTSVNFQITINSFDVEQAVSITSTVENCMIINDTINLLPAMLPESESEALIDLYNSTDGDNWYYNANWLGVRGTECSWYGVFCDESEMHVTGIFLGTNNLYGDIWDSIVKLKNLSGLSLFDNQLSSLPENFGDLQNLSYLNLSNNLFPSLYLSIPEIIPEDSENVQCTLTVNAPIDRDVNLLIDFNNPKRLTIAETVILPKGFTQVNFYLSVIDDMVITCPSNITINTTFQLFNNKIVLSALDYSKQFTPIINDNELKLLKIILPESATEGDQSVEGIIRIEQPADCDLYIPLSSTGNNILNLPKTAIIPKGLTEGIFNFAINDFDTKKSILIEANGMMVSQTMQLIPRMIPESEREALIGLYNSTGGNYWYHNYFWLGDPGTECSWYGVSCDESEMHVVKIFLGSRNLNGNILSSIINLQNLSELNLSDNQLSSLPESFGNLQNLSELNLSDNQLSSLPES
ncbi:MAG: hypothetical protein HQK75_04350, partial [Candidatus Magnetomorum sp.]|nr:hypothetical protein [Candidatus Magnetomorum sp.]